MTLGDIIEKIYNDTKTNSDSYPAASLLIDINMAMDHTVSLIHASGGTWQWDDTNQDDMPIATRALVSGTSRYTLADAHLTIDRIEIKDQNGNWQALDQIDQQELKGPNKYSLTDYRETSGTPLEYDVSGATITLYPAPNYSQDASLKIFYTRAGVSFTSADMDAPSDIAPGFNSLFHPLIPALVAYDYWLPSEPARANGFMLKIQRMEEQLKQFYSLRNRDNPVRLAPAQRSCE